MTERNAFVWFETRGRMPYKTGVIEKGKVELFVDAHGEKENGRCYDESIFILTGNGERYVIVDSFEIIKEVFILPEECMISGVGDIYCAKNQTIFPLTHFGRSGYWGTPKRILPNQNHFKYCPECGGKLSCFPVIVQREAVRSDGGGLIGAINEEDI